MVYIHGGFLTYGSSGSSPMNEPNGEELDEEEEEEEQVNWLRAKPSAKLASGKCFARSKNRTDFFAKIRIIITKTKTTITITICLPPIFVF